MDRFSVRVDTDGDEHGKAYEFRACDAQAMLSWLKHDVGVSSTCLSCNGRDSVQLIQMGRSCDRYWMILPVGGRS